MANASPLVDITLTTYHRTRQDIKRWNIDRQGSTWKLGKQIGGSVFSIVFEGRYSQYSKEVVAVKRIPKGAQDGTKEQERSFVREVQNFAIMSEV
jgi:hypothetical protein